jgi:hypothetical protein
MMSKHRVALDLPEVHEFEPKSARPVETGELARSIGQDAGFLTRHSPQTSTSSVSNPTFDARSLRRSNRTAQLGIAVRPETKDRFWRVAQQLGVQSGEEVLEALLAAFEGKRR